MCLQDMDSIKEFLISELEEDLEEDRISRETFEHQFNEITMGTLEETLERYEAYKARLPET